MRALSVVLLSAAALVAVSGCPRYVAGENTSALDAPGMSATGRSTSTQPEGQAAGAAVAEPLPDAGPESAPPSMMLGESVGVRDGGTASNPFGPGGLGTSTSRPLLPPGTPGDSVSRFEGCLASASPSESDGASFPVRTPPPGTRGGPPPPPALVAAPTGGGFVLEHHLDHACCLKGHAQTTVSGNVVTVTEQLEGQACRCLCASTLRAAVAVKPGTYTVKVNVSEAGSTRAAGETTVTVK